MVPAFLGSCNLPKKTSPRCEFIWSTYFMITHVNIKVGKLWKTWNSHSQCKKSPVARDLPIAIAKPVLHFGWTSTLWKEQPSLQQGLWLFLTFGSSNAQEICTAAGSHPRPSGRLGRMAQPPHSVAKLHQHTKGALCLY